MRCSPAANSTSLLACSWCAGTAAADTRAARRGRACAEDANGVLCRVDKGTFVPNRADVKGAIFAQQILLCLFSACAPFFFSSLIQIKPYTYLPSAERRHASGRHDHDLRSNPRSS